MLDYGAIGTNANINLTFASHSSYFKGCLQLKWLSSQLLNSIPDRFFQIFERQGGGNFWPASEKLVWKLFTSPKSLETWYNTFLGFKKTFNVSHVIKIVFGEVIIQKHFFFALLLIFPLPKVDCLFFLKSNDLTLSWRRPLSYRNQSINLQSKSMDWFLYDNGLRHERVKPLLDALLHIFDDNCNIQNKGKAINNTYLHCQLLFESLLL